MNKVLVFIFAAFLCVCAEGSEAWRSVTGERLRGAFIRYEADAELVVIRRDRDGEVFSIPEKDLHPADRLKAVRLGNQDVEPYWYSDYGRTQSQKRNLGKRCLLFYRSETPEDDFELFYHKLFYRKEFREMVEKEAYVVYVQENLPRDMRELLRISRLSSSDEWRSYLKEALLFHGVFGRERVVGESVGIMPLRRKGDGNPFSEGGKDEPMCFVRFELIERVLSADQDNSTGQGNSADQKK